METRAVDFHNPKELYEYIYDLLDTLMGPVSAPQGPLTQIICDPASANQYHVTAALQHQTDLMSIIMPLMDAYEEKINRNRQ